MQADDASFLHEFSVSRMDVEEATGQDGGAFGTNAEISERGKLT